MSSHRKAPSLRSSSSNGLGDLPNAAASSEDAEKLPISKKMPTDFGSTSDALGTTSSSSQPKAQGSGLDVVYLSREFGFHFIIMLSASQHLLKGFSHALCRPSERYLFAAYKIDGPQTQIFGGVKNLPWAMKPILGLVSDLFPIGGYHKAPYMFMTCVCGVFASFTIGSTTLETLSVHSLVACLFMVELMFSSCDLLTEAKYAEKMREKPEHGPALVSFVWFGLNGGSLFATLLVGTILVHFGPRAPFLVALPFMGSFLWPTSRNYLGEVLKTPQQAERDRRQLLDQKEACFLCLFMFLGTIILTTIGIVFEDVRLNAAAAIIVALAMLLSFSVVLKPVIAKVNAFFLIQMSLNLHIGGASFYFYTDTPEQYPEGPHFSQLFFTTVLGVVGSLFSLLGIYTYQRYAVGWSYRGLLFWTNVVASVLSMVDVAIFARLNVSVGLPDSLCVIGGEIMYALIGQWMWMPGIIMMSHLCPSGMEATMYALLAGCHNLGGTIASNCGAVLLEWLNCQPDGSDGESKQFEKLWLASLLTTIFPTMTLVLLPFLIPDAKQTVSLIGEDDRDACAGSLWRRWREPTPLVFD